MSRLEFAPLRTRRSSALLDSVEMQRQAIAREEGFAAAHGLTREQLAVLPPAARRIANAYYLQWCAAQDVAR